MDLESRMKEKADLHNQFGNKGYNCIPLRDALTIAREYAEEHAIAFLDSIREYERQGNNQICYDERESKELYDIWIAPLATEVQDGK